MNLKSFKCTGCGGTEMKVVSKTEVRCLYCNSAFYEKPKHDLSAFREPVDKVVYSDPYLYEENEEEQSRMVAGAIMAFVFIAAIIVFAFTSLHNREPDVSDVEEQQEAVLESNDNTGQGMGSVDTTTVNLAVTE